MEKEQISLPTGNDCTQRGEQIVALYFSEAGENSYSNQVKRTLRNYAALFAKAHVDTIWYMGMEETIALEKAKLDKGTSTWATGNNPEDLGIQDEHMQFLQDVSTLERRVAQNKSLPGYTNSHRSTLSLINKLTHDFMRPTSLNKQGKNMDTAKEESLQTIDEVIDLIQELAGQGAD